ncbi:myocilin isoform X1 [Electrophorus electricus]|uniref:Myocilin n=1 Tax=Electrophorus electricus TaxID=8005 RepID=A0A4W4FHW0_ELEEL|nr:myocilin isoform X1 [Electrophorus electricus]
MWVLAVVWFSGVLIRAEAQGTASFWRGNDRSGRCQYSFTVDSPTEASCPLPGSSPEVEALKSRLALLEVLVAHLAGGETGPGPAPRLQEAYTQALSEKTQLQREKDRLGQRVEELQRRVEELQQEAERLRSRPCAQPPPPSTPLYDNRPSPAGGSGGTALSHLSSRPGRTPGDTSSLRDPSWHSGSPGYQELKAEVAKIPAPSPEDADDTKGCGELLSVGEPFTHRKTDTISGKYGVWMQDPEAVSPYGPGMVWRIDTVGNEVRQIFGYEDLQQLSRGFPTKVLLLPEAVESTGAAMFRGSLYYQRRRSRTLLRYDLASESVAARRDLPHAGFHGQFPYSWGGYTDIDFAVDEQGLWVIYSTNKARGAIVISLLDHHNLEVKRSWETNIRKTTVANAFMICGRLYTVASYSSLNTTVNYSFDTATGVSKAVAIPFKNRHRYNSMIDYNPGQRKLFAWDNHHLVSYDVRLGKPQ